MIASKSCCICVILISVRVDRYHLAILSLASETLSSMIKLAGEILPFKTLIMDGVGVGLLKKFCLFLKPAEEPNEVPAVSRDGYSSLQHLAEGSPFQKTVMITSRHHRQLLRDLVVTSSSSTSNVNKRVTASAYKKFLEWVEINRPALAPYVKVISSLLAVDVNHDA